MPISYLPKLGERVVFDAEMQRAFAKYSSVYVKVANFDKVVAGNYFIDLRATIKSVSGNSFKTLDYAIISISVAGKEISTHYAVANQTSTTTNVRNTFSFLSSKIVVSAETDIAVEIKLRDKDNKEVAPESIDTNETVIGVTLLPSEG